jgi:hypothetical protein
MTRAVSRWMVARIGDVAEVVFLLGVRGGRALGWVDAWWARMVLGWILSWVFTAANVLGRVRRSDVCPFTNLVSTLK